MITQVATVEARGGEAPLIDDGLGWQQRQVERSPIASRILAEDRQRRAENAAQFMRPHSPPGLPQPPDLDVLREAVRQAQLADREAQAALAGKEQAAMRAAELVAGARERLDHIAEIKAQHTAALSAATRDWLAAGGVGHQPTIAPPADLAAARGERATVEGELTAFEAAHKALASELVMVQRAAGEARGTLNAAAKRVIAAEATDKALLYLRLIEEAAELHAGLQITALQHLPEEPGRPASPLRFDAVAVDIVTNPRHNSFTADVAPATVAARTRAIADAVHQRFAELIAGDPPEVEAEAAE